MKDNIKYDPLLFIDSINDDVVGYNQEIFDSRNNNNNKSIKKISHDTDFYIKISRLILMYNKNKKIICKVKLINKEEYEVQVIKQENNILKCFLINNEKSISFDINEIEELLIQEINY